MRIDQNGNVGIGTSNPSVKGHIAYTTEATANRAYGLVVNGNDTGTAGESASIFLGARDNTVRGTSIAAEFQSSSGDHDLIFSTSAASSAPSERMRIDSSGNLLVGTTSNVGTTDTTGSGHDLRATGAVLHKRDGGTVQYLNRLTSDGDIVDLRKDGTQIGKIAVAGGNNLSIGGTVADHAGLLFGTHVVFPTEAGSLANGTISLGDSSYSFKDIVLSGTVDGGNGSASDPTFTFSSDTNTGMFRVEANTLGFSTNGAEEMRLTAAGDLHVDGNVIAYSTTISDRRLKSDITNISNALDKVGQINGVTFVRNHNGEKAAGIVAQEIMEVLPEAVKSQALPLQTGEQDQEYYVVEYDAVTGLLVEAVKELKARVEALENS